MNTVIASPHAPKAAGPSSQAVEAGGALYVSGQLPDRRRAPGRLDEKASRPRRAGQLANLGHILPAKPDTIIPTW